MPPTSEENKGFQDNYYTNSDAKQNVTLEDLDNEETEKEK